MEQMSPIESREIRGLSWRGLISLMIATGTTLISIFGVYYSIVGKLEVMNIKSEAFEKVVNLQIQALQVNYTALQVQVDNLRNENRKRDIQDQASQK
jgi:hypothetical protein